MAGLKVNLSTSSSIATGTVAKTILQYTAPATGGAKTAKIVLSGDGTNPTAAKGIIEIVKGATGGTAGGTPAPAKIAGHTGSPLGSGKENFSAEPTGGTVVDTGIMHPQWAYPFTKEIQLNPAETVGVRATFATSIGMRVSIDLEE